MYVHIFALVVETTSVDASSKELAGERALVFVVFSYASARASRVVELATVAPSLYYVGASVASMKMAKEDCEKNTCGQQDLC